MSWFFSTSQKLENQQLGDYKQEKTEQTVDVTEQVVETTEQVTETKDQVPDTIEQHSVEQIEQIVQRLHEEKQKAAELKQTIEQLQSLIEEKDKKLKEQAELISQHVAEGKETVTPETPKQPEVTPENETADAVKEQLKALSELVDARMKELIADRTELSTKLDAKTTQYEELIARVQEDRYRKDKVKILRRNINLRNLVSSVLDDYQHETPKMAGHDTAAATFLETQLEKIVEKIDADLRQEMLVPLVKGVEGSDFDAEHQEIVERQETDNPELDGKVFRSVAPGYVWTLPYIFKPRVNENGEEVYTYNFLLRSEDVITYKYIKKEE